MSTCLGLRITSRSVVSVGEVVQQLRGGRVELVFVELFGINSKCHGLEAVLTAAFVLVILLVTEKVAAPGFAGIAIGLTLTLVHLVGIPLTGTSVNPARSLGPALFEGGVAMQQVWLFIVAPLVGAVIAVLIWKLTKTSEEETRRLVAGDEA